MLSICIPAYNFNLSTFVNQLAVQATNLDVPAEIIVIDDGSFTTYTSQYLFDPMVQYIPLQENIGRSRIRNLFLKYATYDYLLFLDCDSSVISKTFLIDYIEFIKKHQPMVLVGGSTYPTLKPKKGYRLRWKYSIQRQSKPATIRNQNPSASFMTNNFVAHRSVFESVVFDEKLTQYGHEDTLFGFELGKKGIEVIHLDNPVLNIDLDEDEDFIRKTEMGIENLVKISKQLDYDLQFHQSVTLLRIYSRLKKTGLLLPLLWLFLLFKKPTKLLLSNGVNSLLLFNFYKLGLVVQNFRKIS